MPRILASAGLLALVAAAPPAEPATQNRDMICVTVAHLWRGTAEDVRRIAEIPVPQSYKALFFAGGCTRFSLIEESLVDWHLAFGNEATTTAALGFLEQDYTARVPETWRFAADLVRVRKQAEPDLKAAQAFYAKTPTDWEGARRAMDRPKIRRLAGLLGALEHYDFLAGEYLRAAEFYGSAPLLDKARPFLGAAQAGAKLLYGSKGDRGLESAAHVAGYDPDYGKRVSDLEMRAAVLKARLSRSPSDIDAANATVRARYSPVLRTGLDEAYEHGDFCDIGERKDLEEFASACREENDFPARLFEFWRSRASLDLLMAADPEHYVALRRSAEESGAAFMRVHGSEPSDAGPRDRERGMHDTDRLLRLMERDLTEESRGHRGFSPANDPLVALLLLRADTHARLARAKGGSDVEGNDRSDYVGEALKDLARAARLATPNEAPGRFRQAAEAYMALRLEALGWPLPDPNTRWWDNPPAAREAAYLAHTLKNLDRIAAGEGPPS